MNMLECMNITIEYIEDHLLEELHMPTIANATGTSESDIQKTFYALIEYYSAGDMLAEDYRAEIWIPVKSAT